MIAQTEARRQAVDFLDSEKLPELSKMVKKGDCLWEIFPAAERSLGKKRVLVLYRKLPTELRKYFLIYFLSRSGELNAKLREIDDECGYPEDPAPNSEYFRLLEKILVKYLRSKKINEDP